VRSREEYDRQYYAVTGELAKLRGERVRITYGNGHRPGTQQTGVVSTRDFGHCVDTLLDGHGGQMYGDVIRIEQMQHSGRYAIVWEAGL
jgi:hypothetical protein